MEIGNWCDPLLCSHHITISLATGWWKFNHAASLSPVLFSQDINKSSPTDQSLNGGQRWSYRDVNWSQWKYHCSQQIKLQSWCWYCLLQLLAPAPVVFYLVYLFFISALIQPGWSLEIEIVFFRERAVESWTKWQPNYSVLHEPTPSEHPLKEVCVVIVVHWFLFAILKDMCGTETCTSTFFPDIYNWSLSRKHHLFLCSSNSSKFQASVIESCAKKNGFSVEEVLAVLLIWNEIYTN